MSPFKTDKVCFLTARDCCTNFQLASRNLSNLRGKNAQKFHVPDLLRNDYIFVTKEGLMELEATIERRAQNYYRNRKAPSESALEKAKIKTTDLYEREIIRPIIDSESIEGYDDDLRLAVQSDSLKGYLDDLGRSQTKEDNEATRDQ